MKGFVVIVGVVMIIIVIIVIMVIIVIIILYHPRLILNFFLLPLFNCFPRSAYQ